jgi:hypothetical protein
MKYTGRYTEVNKKNLRYLFNSDRGHLYFRSTEKKKAFKVCAGHDYSDLYAALAEGACEFIWIEGESLGTNVEV